MTGAVSEAECLRVAEGDNIHFSLTYFQTCLEWSILNSYWNFFWKMTSKPSNRGNQHGCCYEHFCVKLSLLAKKNVNHIFHTSESSCKVWLQGQCINRISFSSQIFGPFQKFGYDLVFLFFLRKGNPSISWRSNYLPTRLSVQLKQKLAQSNYQKTITTGFILTNHQATQSQNGVERLQEVYNEIFSGD